ncbi:LegC family aminotransferase [Granulosicoccus antarcticus]|uniref:GDP-perosamine synthase n=1 Tax=Granulosicoccus antarcticus IMCC3135 TaxID=1192854 RepID=A0A2Z2NUE6_9GAMM|nr:LegC family aminotransferase [Granulosicoccus antarcticus]ASJ74929.1 GDP-perosamine synthase [Granulosicoccus antarcticus IMCC3135]
MFDSLVDFVRQQFDQSNSIGLHEPRFGERDRQALIEVIDSGMVSSVGQCVDEFEQLIASYAGAAHGIATVNGTSALHVSLLVAGVIPGDLVLTQSLSFVATCNAISYCGAEPVFIDVDRQSLGLAPAALQEFLESQTELRDDGCCWHIETNRRIPVCMPMHTFGFPASIHQIAQLCLAHGLQLVEDSAEALGSWHTGVHCGVAGNLGVLSFNGNKIMTTGGGGMVLTNDAELAKRVRHLTTTARVTEPLKWLHDEVGFNYRLPNLNAALGIAQFASLEHALMCKRKLANNYLQWSHENDRDMIAEQPGTQANHWLNALICNSVEERDQLLEYTCRQGVLSRPVWVPMHRLSMYEHCLHGTLENTQWAAAHILNLPSSVPHGW